MQLIMYFFYNNMSRDMSQNVQLRSSVACAATRYAAAPAATRYSRYAAPPRYEGAYEAARLRGYDSVSPRLRLGVADARSSVRPSPDHTRLYNSTYFSIVSVKCDAL